MELLQRDFLTLDKQRKNDWWLRALREGEGYHVRTLLPLGMEVNMFFTWSELERHGVKEFRAFLSYQRGGGFHSIDVACRCAGFTGKWSATAALLQAGASFDKIVFEIVQNAWVSVHKSKSEESIVHQMDEYTRLCYQRAKEDVRRVNEGSRFRSAPGRCIGQDKMPQRGSAINEVGSEVMQL